MALNYRPPLPRNKTMGIAIVGAGEIVEAAHLPAYRLAGLNVVGIYDIDGQKARRVARQFQLPHIFQSLDELVDSKGVQIVDIAVPSQHLLPVVERAVKRKKHVLCQKPLGEAYAAARKIVDVCREAGVKAAVNQQMRWAPGIQASHQIIDRGWLGELTQATIQVNVLTPWGHWPWMTSLPGMEFLYHSIHYMDSIRYLFGTPEYIFADSAKFPGQPWAADTRTTIIMRFAGETRGLIQDNHNNIAPEDDWYATFRFEGTEGIIKGTNGALYNYPVGRGDTISFLSKQLAADIWISPTLEGKWFPHAFMGSMGELMRAVEEEREPGNSVKDNLDTLRMVFSALRSVEERRPVWLSEIDES